MGDPGEGCTGLIASNAVRHVPFWVYFEVKPTGFAGGLQLGTERKRGVGVTPGFWPEIICKPQRRIMG